MKKIGECEFRHPRIRADADYSRVHAYIAPFSPWFWQEIE